ncbi:hypothetical protein Tsubulata_050932 [Turnera subulata]|uniref:Uncharacterized protein n=1 Tax=Turnera subulata TaxID=218843 RepID=A0A9Q0JHZ1_9ROSI|nr:hypothetical protein Tsubulata_050932 [Turnera subulata]
MGSCASVHKGTPSSEAAMKLGVTTSFRSKKDKLVRPESPPIKDKPAVTTVDHPAAIKSFDNYGSKEEAFFDSQPWLDSDCEDDFYSVNGDFTPSRGNTPVHHSFSAGNPQVRNSVEGRPPKPMPEPSPTGKKRLSDLFKDSIREGPGGNDMEAADNKQHVAANGKTEAKPTILDYLPASANGTPYISGTNSVCSSERTANGDALIEREKSMKSAQCCLPSMISCRSFSDRKKKMSPAVAVNGRAQVISGI